MTEEREKIKNGKKWKLNNYIARTQFISKDALCSLYGNFRDMSRSF